MNEQSVTKSLQLLRDGFKREYAERIYNDERTTTLLMELATEFVDTNIPVIDDENQMELALMLMETISIVAR